MTIQHYETTDIFIGAFIMSKGGDLCGIRIKDAAKGIAAFEISGDDLEGGSIMNTGPAKMTVDIYGHWISGEGRQGLEEALCPVPNGGENRILSHMKKMKPVTN